MDCPQCLKPLAILELDGIEVDHCLACHGTWLDHDELETIVARAGSPPAGMRALMAAAPAGEPSPRRCPRCRRPMRRIEPAPGLELDRCERGDGLWLDRGELRRLLAAWAAADPACAEARLAAFFNDVLGHALQDWARSNHAGGEEVHH